MNKVDFSFISNETEITDPTKDRDGRFKVDPLEEYEETVLGYVEIYINGIHAEIRVEEFNEILATMSSKGEKMMSEKEVEDRWTRVAKDQLEGRTISRVRYLTKKEMERLNWSKRCVVMVLDNGTIVYPSADDVGNEAGVLFTTNEDEPTLPVIS